MRTKGSQTKLFLMPLIAILGALGFFVAPTAAAYTPTISSSGTVSGCGSSSNSYGCTYWWDWSLWGTLYPGQTVYFDFNVYSSAPSGSPVRLDSLTVQTPWATYTDPSLPMVIFTGYNYFNEFAITIPTDQSPGSVLGSIQFTGEFWNGGGFWCSGTGNVCSDTANFTITTSPSSLQQQVSSLQSQATTLNNQIGTLNGQVTSLATRISSLTVQLSQANGNLSISRQTIATDQAALTQAQKDLSTAESNLASAQSQLTSTNAQLTSKEAELTSTQSSLNTTSDLYLPLAAAIPAIVAVLFAFLYFKKKPVASPARYG